MTFNQIVKTRQFLNAIPSVHDMLLMEKFVSSLRGYYGDELNNVDLKIRRYNTIESYSAHYYSRDVETIKGFLEGKLDSDTHVAFVNDIMNYLDEAQSVRGKKEKMSEFITKVYHAYSGVINFDSSIKAIAAQDTVLDLNLYSVSLSMFDGVITKLRQYAISLCEDVTTKESGQTINFSPTINATASTSNNIDISVDISLQVQKAKELANDEGLPDKQLQDVLQRLDEIEKIGKSKESKGKRWEKAKNILKWIAEQGIQVASIVVPVIASCIK